MGVLADEYIRLHADTSRMPRQIRKAGAAAGNDFGSSFGGVLKKVLAGAAVVGAAKVVAGALKTSVMAASDMNETFNKTNIIFGKLTPVVTKFASTAAKDLGLTQQQALEAASSFGDMFTQIGFTGKQVTRMSLNVVRLSADLGSFNNLPTEDVQQRIAAAFRGEYDSLQALVPTINAAAVQQRAMNDTGKKSATQLTAQEKAAATLAIIMEKTQRASGDFARTQGGLANQIKIAKAQLGDMAVTVGRAFLPALSKLFGYITKNIIPAFQDFFNKLSKDKALKTSVQNLKDALAELTGNQDFRQALTDTANAIPPVVQGLADIVTKYGEIAAAVDKFENMSFGAGDKRGGPVGQIIKDFKAGGTIETAIIRFRVWLPATFKQMWADVKAAFVSDINDIVATVSGLDAGVTQSIVNMRDGVVAHVKQMWADVKAWFAGNYSYHVSGVQRWIGQMVAWFGRMKERVVAWVNRMWADAKASFLKNFGFILAAVGRWVGQVVTWFTNLKTRVVAWVARMWSEAKASFTQRQAELVAGVGRFVGRITAWFTTLKNRVVATSRDLWAALKSNFNAALNSLTTRVGQAVSAIGHAWNRIKSVIEVPVKFVVNTVLDKGILAAVRSISNFVGYGPGKNVHVYYGGAPRRQGGTAAGLASGGVLPGYTPGKDVHRFYSATGGVLDLSGGEGIARPELVRAIGADRWNAANRAARVGDVDKGVRYLGGFASGGIAAAEKYARSIGINSIGTYPGHHPSQALARDFMTSNRSVGDKMANWLWTNRRSLNLWYEIWYRRIRSMTREGAGWQAYTRSNPHTDHVHGAWYPAGLSGAVGALSAAAASLDPSKYLNMVTGALGKLKSIEGTPFGKMIGGIPRKLAGAVKAKITSLAGSFMGAAGSGFTAAGGGSNRAIGKRMMLQRWSAGQWPALNSLWTKESGWRTTARNPSSGAYGIPQSLPASKMASAGSDWRTNPATQIKWGLSYIASRYGSPSAAWAHSQRTNWYGAGGVINEPVIGMGMRTGQRYGFGEHGPETVTPGRGGSRPINIIIDLGSGVREIVRGELDEHDEFAASVGRMHR